MNRRRPVLIALILGTLVVTACASFNPLDPLAHRRQQTFITTHPHDRYNAAIQKGEIIRGMSKADVVASWGEPCPFCYGTTRNSWGDTWEYNLFGSAEMGAGSGSIIYFSPGGHVISWSQ
jgi:outer membrane protein assembly factor BamE